MFLHLDLDMRKEVRGEKEGCALGTGSLSFELLVRVSSCVAHLFWL